MIDHLDNNSCASLVVSSQNRTNASITKKDMNIDARVKFALKALKDEGVIERQGRGLYIIIEPTYSNLIQSIVNELGYLIESITMEDGKITSVDPMCYDINSKETDSLAISSKDINTLCEAIGVDPTEAYECYE